MPAPAIGVVVAFLEIWNMFKPRIEEWLDNEAANNGLTRDQLNAMTKGLIGETKDITDEDASDNP